MTKIFTKNKNEFFDDYAHHPTEIASILKELNSLLKTEKSFQFLNHIGIQGLFYLKMLFQKRLLNQIWF